MSWVSLEDDFHSNPKIIDAGLDGCGLFARALSFCGAFLTDGFVSTEQMLRLADRKRKTIAKCVTVGLFREVEGGYQIPDYLELNPSREWVLNRRAELAAAGKKGAKKRWEKKAKPPALGDNLGDSPGHDPGEGQTVADPIADSWLTTPAPYPTGEKGDEGSSNGSSEVRPQRATPDFTTPLELDPEKELAIAKFRKLKFSDDKTVDVVRHKYGHLPVAAFHSALESAAGKGNSIEYAMGALRSMVAEGQYA